MLTCVRLLCSLIWSYLHKPHWFWCLMMFIFAWAWSDHTYAITPLFWSRSLCIYKLDVLFLFHPYMYFIGSFDIAHISIDVYAHPCFWLLGLILRIYTYICTYASHALYYYDFNRMIYIDVSLYVYASLCSSSFWFRFSDCTHTCIWYVGPYSSFFWFWSPDYIYI